MYINLRDLLLNMGEGDDRFTQVLREQLVSHRLVSLDLANTREVLCVERIPHLVQALRDYRPVLVCSVMRCEQTSDWMKAAASCDFPLLHWRTFSRQDGWDLLGLPLRGLSYTLFRALCSLESATARDLAHDSIIVPQHPRLGNRTIEKFVETGRAPNPGPGLQDRAIERFLETGQTPNPGPSLRDSDDVRHHLRQLVQRRYIIEIKPGHYCVAPPSQPPRV